MLVFNIKYVGFRSSDFSTSLRPDLSEAPFVKQRRNKKAGTEDGNCRPNNINRSKLSS